MTATVEMISPLRASEFVEEWYAFANDTHFWMIWRHAALMEFIKAEGLPLDKTLRVLDVGAGNGRVQSLVEKDSHWTVDCVDLNYAGLSMGSNGRGKRFYYDIFDSAPDLVGKYDLIFLFDVIEHLTDTAVFLRATAKHLKPGGKILLNVPALQSMYSEYDRKVGHHRRYNRTTLSKEIMAAELKPGTSRYWGACLVPVLLARKLYLAWRGRREETVKTGFQPPATWINRCFLLLAHAETVLLKKPPVGSSLLMVVSEK